MAGLGRMLAEPNTSHAVEWVPDSAQAPGGPAATRSSTSVYRSRALVLCARRSLQAHPAPALRRGNKSSVFALDYLLSPAGGYTAPCRHAALSTGEPCTMYS
jgi:hypothetical protein